MSRFIHIILLVLLSKVAWAQHSDFPLLYSHGKLPYEFITPPEKRAQEHIEKRKNAGEILSPKDVDFIYATEYTIDYYIESGFVTTGDSISTLAQKILDRLLSNNIQLRQKIKIHLLRSTETRLFSFDNGNIFLSTGLVSKLNSEDELAFFIAREIIHIRDEHAKEQYIKAYSTQNKSDYMKAILFLNTEYEELADKKAIYLLQAAGYLISKSITALEAQLSYMNCFGNHPFSISFFEHGSYIFPEKYALTEIVKHTNESEISYQYPNLKYRIDQLRQLVSETSSNTQNLKPTYTEIFYRCRLLAREEVIRLYLLKNEFENAIYGSYSLLIDDSTNLFAKHAIANALCTIALFNSPEKDILLPDIYMNNSKDLFQNTNNNDSDVYKTKAPSIYSGEIQKINYFLSSLSHVEITVLALDWSWKTYKKSKYKQSEYNQAAYMMKILKANYALTVDSFAIELAPPLLLTQIYNDSIIILKNKTPFPKKNTANESIYQVPYNLSEESRKKNGTIRNVFPGTYYHPFQNISELTIKLTFLDDTLYNNRRYKVAYNYYMFAFTDHIKDTTFVKEFNKAPNYFIHERLYLGEEYHLYNLERKFGKNTKTCLASGITAEQFTYDNRQGKLSLDTENTKKLQSDQMNTNKRVWGTGITYLSKEDFQASDAVRYSYWCMLKTQLSIMNYYIDNNQTIIGETYANLSDTIISFYKTSLVYSSYILSETINQTGFNNSRSKITTLIFDIKSAEPIILWREEHASLTMPYHIKTHYTTLYKSKLKPFFDLGKK